MNKGPKTPDDMTPLERANYELELEQRRWRQAGLHPGMLNFDIFEIATKIDVLTGIIKDRFGIETEELDAIYRKEFLEKMAAIREQFEKDKLAAQPAKLISPEGRPLL